MPGPRQIEEYAKAVRENVKGATAESIAKDVAFTFLTPSQIFRCWLDSLWFAIRIRTSR